MTHFLKYLKVVLIIETNHTKEQLIIVTEKVIATKGLAAVNLRDLGKELNLSRSAIYRHFKNKDDLLATVAAKIITTLHTDVAALLNHATGNRTFIKNILLLFYNFGKNNPEKYKLIFYKNWPSTDYPQLNNAIQTLNSSYQRCFALIVDNGLTIDKTSTELCNISSAFIVGMVDLNLTQHLETEVGISDPVNLLDSFLDTILIETA
ncbi:hypothetical protein B8A32_12065 [Loigolactobacillus backii]|nr:hypothetical protein B8A32_12065 [Loigolactobacillus backii]